MSSNIPEEAQVKGRPLSTDIFIFLERGLPRVLPALRAYLDPEILPKCGKLHRDSKSRLFTDESAEAREGGDRPKRYENTLLDIEFHA